MGVGDGGLLPRETRPGGKSLLIRHALAPVPIQLVFSESDLIRLCPLQMFERQKAEDAIISFALDRTEFDITDPEGHNCTPVEDVDPEAAARSGKTPPLIQLEIGRTMTRTNAPFSRFLTFARSCFPSCYPHIS